MRAECRAQIPAVTHVDGTARLQSVAASENPLYHRLISRFAARTGVPVVLNTSFNLRGEPIAHRPAEAVADFLRSDMDALFLGSLLAEKPNGPWRRCSLRFRIVSVSGLTGSSYAVGSSWLARWDRRSTRDLRPT